MKISELSIQSRGRLAKSGASKWKKIAKGFSIDPNDLIIKALPNWTLLDYSRCLFKDLAMASRTMENLASVFRTANVGLANLITSENGFPEDLLLLDLTECRCKCAGANNPLCRLCHQTLIKGACWKCGDGFGPYIPKEVYAYSEKQLIYLCKNCYYETQ